jgi:hypothetical protein
MYFFMPIIFLIMIPFDKYRNFNDYNIIIPYSFKISLNLNLELSIN